MFMVIQLVFFCVCLVGATDISFKEITISWNLQYGSECTKSVYSSNNLKENLPSVWQIQVVAISGEIPVLYENSVSDIRNLKELKLRNVTLEEIRPGAFKNIQINYLWLGPNNITKLSRGIFENVELTSLSFYRNRIHEIEVGAFSGVELLELSLEYNELEEIDVSVFNIPDLVNLHLGHNKIKALQREDFKNLPKLERLSLSENKIRTVGEGIFQNSVLKELNLAFNEISSIDSKFFDNMTKLESIHLSYNKLTEWDKNWFYNTPRLRNVYSGDNKIKEIPDKAFQNLDNVQQLYLTYNEMLKFSPKAFVKNEENGKVKMTAVFLQSNNLTCIEGPLKDVFGSVKYVYLRHNPWDENCEIKATIEDSATIMGYVTFF